MKFLCPSCKAKYQIADEKVAGRNVKMKCRKCGHLIHVNQAAAGGSELPPPPEAPAAVAAPGPHRPSAVAKAGGEQPSAPAASPRPAPVRPSAPRQVSRPVQAVPRGSGGVAPAAGARPAPVPRAAAPVRRPAPARPVGGAAQAAGELPQAVAAAPVSPPFEAPSASPEPSPRPPFGSSLRAVAALQAEAEAEAPISSSPASGSAPASAGYGSYREDEDEATVVASVGLAAALTRAMDEEAAPNSALVAVEGEAEWYVGVAGSPEGPLNVPQLKERIAGGAVDLSTLVWKDGFDDWRPLSQFPELAAVVEEFRPSKPGAAFGDPTAADDLGFAALGFGQQRPRVQAPAPLSSIATSAPPAPITGSEGIVTEARQSEIPAGVPRRSHSGAWAWLAVVAALGLGVTIGIVVWGNQKPVIKYVEVPVEGAAPAAPGTAATAEPEKLPDTEVAGDPTKVAAKNGSTKPATATAAGPAETKGGGLAGLQGLKDGPAGPSGPAGTSAPRAGGGDQLDSSQVQRVVSSYTSSVKRSCWQPALSTRASDAPSTARVSVTIQVSPSGSVSSVSTSGDPKGYRGLAGCIGGRVRGWQFPAAGGPTTVNVPFVFAAQ